MHDRPTRKSEKQPETAAGIGEFGLIDLFSTIVPPGEGTVAGIGDDAAVLTREGGEAGYLLLATDCVCEGVHFLREQGAERIGRKALAVNLSDIAAMGGVPRWAAVGLGIPPDLPVEFAVGLYRGMSALARTHGVGIVGGDTYSSREGVCLGVTVLGEVEPDHLARRSGAAPGQAICVTGTLGNAAAGKHLDFTPRLLEARFLTGAFPVGAMIDISDGLGADLEKLCRASGTGAAVRLESLPVEGGDGTDEAAAAAAAGSGEEFELLFSLPPERVPELLEVFPRRTGCPVTVVGEILPEEDGLCFTFQGRPRSRTPRGYDHFRRGEPR
ncbi:MAG TPA: thiamine-phosphate kinase [bacterium]|nr:thiamine-phosphate kinase [bacterium]HPQ67111.1 thiamine-phosphate kinase [bacterium]